jgi:hypothetical protein
VCVWGFLLSRRWKKNETNKPANKKAFSDKNSGDAEKQVLRSSLRALCVCRKSQTTDTLKNTISLSVSHSKSDGDYDDQTRDKRPPLAKNKRVVGVGWYRAKTQTKHTTKHKK